jgi:hypothetical protein
MEKTALSSSQREVDQRDRTHRLINTLFSSAMFRRGGPRDPITEEEIAVKFTALGGDVIGKDKFKKLQSLS